MAVAVAVFARMLLATFTITVAMASALVFAALPPGYDEQLFCEAQACLRRKEPASIPSGFVGPKRAFHECFHALDEAVSEVAATWGTKMDPDLLEKYKAQGLHTGVCSDSASVSAPVPVPAAVKMEKLTETEIFPNGDRQEVKKEGEGGGSSRSVVKEKVGEEKEEVSLSAAAAAEGEGEHDDAYVNAESEDEDDEPLLVFKNAIRAVLSHCREHGGERNLYGDCQNTQKAARVSVTRTLMPLPGNPFLGACIFAATFLYCLCECLWKWQTDGSVPTAKEVQLMAAHYKLAQDAEVFNTPSTFMTYAKITREKVRIKKHIDSLEEARKQKAKSLQESAIGTCIKYGYMLLCIICAGFLRNYEVAQFTKEWFWPCPYVLSGSMGAFAWMFVCYRVSKSGFDKVYNVARITN